MGFFHTSVDPSAEPQLKSALKNIELWEELESGGEYLISGFVKSQINQAIIAIQEGNLTKQENNDAKA